MSPAPRFLRWIGLLAALALPALAQTPAAADKLFSARFTPGPSWDAKKSPNDQAGMRDHSSNLARLRGQGHIVLGARYGDTGLVVFRAATEDAVLKFLEPDTTLRNGVFKIQVDAFRPFYHGSTSTPTSPEATALRVYLESLNRLDVEMVLAVCADNFAWYSWQGEKVVTEVQGRANLSAWLSKYFKDLPSARAEFLSMEQTGPFLTVRERTVWQEPGGQRKAMQAIGVYEVREGLVQRVWYYPPTDDTAAVR